MTASVGRHLSWWVTAACAAWAVNPATAAVLNIQPSLVVNEIYSDNINLDSSNEQNEYVTQVIPSVSIDRQGGRLDMNVDYAWENIFYAQESWRNTTYNRLRADASAEVAKENLFIDASSSIRQQVINNQNRLVLDNINNASRTEIRTYSIGPRLRNHLGNVADTEVYLQSGKVDFSNTNQFSDSDILRVGASIESGRRFNAIRWNAQYMLDETRRSSGDRTKLESIEGSLEGRLVEYLSWRINGGFINDDLRSSRSVNRGYHLSAGAVWKPTANLTMDASYGYNSKNANIEYMPTRRTSLRIGYLNRDVGSNPGDRWSLLFRHFTRHHAWDITYAEDTTNLQQLEFISSASPSLINVGGSLIDRNSLIFPQSDEDFVRKILQSSLTLRRAKSTLQLRVGGERRDFQKTDKRDKYIGGNAQWDWRMSARSSLSINGGYLSRHFGVDQVDDVNWYAGMALNRDLSEQARGQIAYRHIERDNSDDAAGDYQENRINMGVSIVF